MQLSLQWARDLRIGFEPKFNNKMSVCKAHLFPTNLSIMKHVPCYKQYETLRSFEMSVGYRSILAVYKKQHEDISDVYEMGNFQILYNC